MVFALIITGTLFELAGIVLAWRELRQRRRDVRAFEAIPPSGYGRGFLYVDAHGGGHASRPEPPTLEDRVEALERAVPALRAEQRAAEVRARQNAKRVAERLTQDLGRSVTDRLDAVKTLLLNATRPTRTAYAAIGLLVGGLLLQSAANLVQVLTAP